MQKTILAATLAAGLGMGGAAHAADLYSVGAKDAYTYAPANTWAGFYLGLHAGAAWANDDIKDLDGLNGNHYPVTPDVVGRPHGSGASYGLSDTALIGGGQAGYNWQSGNIVYGLEADLGGLGLGGRKFDPNFPGGTYSGLDAGLSGDITGRLGLAFGNTLVYTKGGFAYFTGDAYVDNYAGGFGGGRATTGDYTGWTIGAGLEHALNPSVSVKVEYQYFDFGTQNAVLTTPCFGNFRYSNDLTANAVTVGLNYHLGGGGYVPLK